MLGAVAVGDANVTCTFLTIEKDNLMRTHEVRDFSKRGDALPIPNLIHVQIAAYARFLEATARTQNRAVFEIPDILQRIATSVASRDN